jgi:short-subunit dehydrogenase involved in D-alanine esterification of teichoic acids
MDSERTGRTLPPVTGGPCGIGRALAETFTRPVG